jgi:hypothetical protein
VTRAHRRRAAPALLLALGACVTQGYQPLRVEPKGGLPADAFARCESLLGARYRRLVEADAERFLLQTDWVAGPDRDVAGQVRATVYRDGDAIACIVEARYLTLGWLDKLPSWSSPRADAALERDLGDAIAAALSSGAAEASADASRPSSR